jgi:hypothetical protein
LTNAERYVRARIDADALFKTLTADERREAETALRWISFAGSPQASKAGRPAGSKNKKTAEIPQEPMAGIAAEKSA